MCCAWLLVALWNPADVFNAGCQLSFLAVAVLVWGVPGIAGMSVLLGLNLSGVRDPLQQVFTRWDGKGVPGDVGGEDIALPMRLFHLADAVEVHHRTEGTDAAIKAL